MSRNCAASRQEGSQFALRVGQLDCAILDNELESLLWRQFEIVKLSLPNALEKVGRILDRFDPEMKLLLRTVTVLVPLLQSGATVGQKLLDIFFTLPNSKPNKSLLVAYYGLCTLLPYIKQRFAEPCLHDGFQFSDNSIFPINRWKSAAKLVNRFVLLVDFVNLLNFCVFLLSGRYMTLSRRIFRLRMAHNRRPTIGEIDFDSMNRELIWYGFADVLLYLMPAARNVRSFWKKMRRKMGSFRRGVSEEANLAEIRLVDLGKAKFGGLMCTICEKEVILPCLAGCAHVFCYYCIGANLNFDNEFFCPNCDRKLSKEKLQFCRV